MADKEFSERNNDYKPMFNCDRDFEQLWKSRSLGGKCFNDSVSSIWSDSYIFRSFRNEFETDHLFTKRSIEMLKSGKLDLEAADKNGLQELSYIPGYRVQSFLPSCSELTRIEMNECFKMYKNICQNKPLSTALLSTYNKYIEIIQKEQQVYQCVCQNAWNRINFMRTSEIKPEVSLYTSTSWKKRVERVMWYPKHYIKNSDIPLVDDTGKKSEIRFLKTLSSHGEILYCETPSIKLKRLNVYNSNTDVERLDRASDEVNISDSYKFIHPKLIKNGYHPEVSKDKIAETLAIENNLHVVMSASSFLCLMDNYPDVNSNSWTIPIVIKQLPMEGNYKKVIFIDKVFPPKSLSAHDRNKIYCKKKVRNMLQRFTNEHPSKDEKSSAGSSDVDDITELESFGIVTRSIRKERSECKEKQKKKTIEKSCNSNKIVISESSEDELKIDLSENEEDFGGKSMPEPEIKTRSCLKKHKMNEDKPHGIINYNLWSLSCETSSVLLKTNLKNLNIMIRCKLGSKLKSDNSIYTISTKLEYQPEFGAEVATLSEITRDWANVLIRPGHNFLRVRLDPVNGDFIMYEKKNLHDLTSEFQNNHSKNPYDRLSSVQALLGQLTELSEGNYLLSHTPDNGMFAQLYKQTSNKHTFNLVLGYLGIDTSIISSCRGKWCQIDQKVLTPTCEHFTRIPATFHPKVAKLSSKLEAPPLGITVEKTPKKKKKPKKKKNKKAKVTPARRSLDSTDDEQLST